jgi:hypothetical protein
MLHGARTCVAWIRLALKSFPFSGSGGFPALWSATFRMVCQ